MKKALFLALFLVLPYHASAGDAPPEARASEADSISYRVKSSATVLEAPDALKLKEVVTSEGKGLWAVHEVPLEEAPYDCGEIEWPDAIDDSIIER